MGLFDNLFTTQADFDAAAERRARKFSIMESQEKRAIRADERAEQAAQSKEISALLKIGGAKGATDAVKADVNRQLLEFGQFRAIAEKIRAKSIAQLTAGAKPELFALLRGGAELTDIPQAFEETEARLRPEFERIAEQPISLFDFGQKKTVERATGEGPFRKGTVVETDPSTGDVSVVQAPLSVKDVAFSRLSKEQQEKIVSAGVGPEINIFTGDQIPAEKATRSAIQKDIILIDDRLRELRKLAPASEGGTFEDEFLTLGGVLRAGASIKMKKWFNIPAKVTEARLKKLGLVSKEDEDFAKRRAKFLLPAFEILNRTIKDITGAAVREGEEGRLGASTTDPTRDGPIEFKAKREAVIEILEGRRKDRMIMLVRGLEYNKENVNAVPLDSRNTVYKTEVLGQQISEKERTQVKINTIKEATDRGAATALNTPTTADTPTKTTDKIRFDNFDKLIEANKPKDSSLNTTSLSKTHPQSMQILLAGIESKDITPAALKRILKTLESEKLTDVQLQEKLKALLGQ